jgi:hypothetical protein
MNLRWTRGSGGPLLLSVLLLGGALASVAARAEGPATKGHPARQAEVEIVEARGKTTQTMRLVVSFTDNEASQVAAQAGDVQYLLKLSRNTHARPGPVLSCDVERKGRSGRSVHDARIKSAAIVELGRRLTVARVVRPDGTQLEVSVTIR